MPWHTTLSNKGMQVVRAHENACVCAYTPNPVHSDACIVAMYIYTNVANTIIVGLSGMIHCSQISCLPLVILVWSFI